jgi:hypothetical protein
MHVQLIEPISLIRLQIHRAELHPALTNYTSRVRAGSSASIKVQQYTDDAHLLARLKVMDYPHPAWGPCIRHQPATGLPLASAKARHEGGAEGAARLTVKTYCRLAIVACTQAWCITLPRLSRGKRITLEPAMRACACRCWRLCGPTLRE